MSPPAWTRPAGVVEQHQREQAECLGLVGHQGTQGAGEADGLGGQALADQILARCCRVALVEQEIEDGQHGARAVHQLMRRWHPERDARVAHLLLGPGQALRHRRLGHEERPRDLCGRQAREGPQRERDLRLERQSGVATGEHEPQPVVRHVRRVVGEPAGRFVGCAHRGHLLQLRSAQLASAQNVEGAVPGHRREPGAGAARDAVAGPTLGRPREGILRALLGKVPVTGDPDEGGHHTAPLVTERAGDGGLDVGGYISQIGLTSTQPVRAPGSRAATSIASSRSLQSTRK